MSQIFTTENLNKKLLALALASSLGLAACGTETVEGEETDASTSVSFEDTEVPAEEGETDSEEMVDGEEKDEMVDGEMKDEDHDKDEMVDGEMKDEDHDKDEDKDKDKEGDHSDDEMVDGEEKDEMVDDQEATE